ncbi:DUF7522 family protein [Natronomonas sp. EA1]|uniref:DUF7522 family protein n=1 Tax=Natronomonas sp. EA1 TaxID=3421655 RepID=UPI003EB8F1AF
MSRTSFLDLFRGFAGDALRDVWVFDKEGEACVYLREDVADQLEGHDPTTYIDNERYGFITRQTYEALTYTEYQYTVRGFGEFEQFRTFLPGVDGYFGVLASVDPDHNHDYGALYRRLLGETGYEYAALADSDGNPSRATADD